MSTSEENLHQPDPASTGMFLAVQAHDAEAQLQFWTGLGFVENVIYRDGDTIAHGQLDWPAGGGIMFGTYSPAAWNREPGSATAYLFSTDLERLYQTAQELGATVIRPLADTDYSSREFTIADPEGNLWAIGSYPGQPSKVSR